MTLSISLLKINFIVNVQGFEDESNTYSILNSDFVSSKIQRFAALQNVPQRTDPVAPKGFILFTDQVKLRKKDFKAYKGLKTELLELLVREKQFLSFICGVRASRSVTVAGRPKIPDNTPSGIEEKREIALHNIKLYFKLLFNQGSPFYFNSHPEPYTLMGYTFINKADPDDIVQFGSEEDQSSNMGKRGIVVKDVDRDSSNNIIATSNCDVGICSILSATTGTGTCRNSITAYYTDVSIDLEDEKPQNVKKNKKRLASCHQRKESIRKISNNLPTLRKIIVFIWGENLRKPRHIKMIRPQRYTGGSRRRGKRTRKYRIKRRHHHKTKIMRRKRKIHTSRPYRHRKKKTLRK